MITNLIKTLQFHNKSNIVGLVSNVQKLDLKKYHWEQYKKIVPNTYNKTVIFRDNKFEIILISWDKNSKTKIHNHPSNGCIMKILEGELLEEIYDTKTKEKIGVNKYVEGNTSYIHDDLYYHKIINGNENTYSLHIYSPPNFYD